MNELTLVGYWRNRDAPHWPDPAWFADKDWNKILRKKIIQYLHAGEPVLWAGGFSWCRFRCGDTTLAFACDTMSHLNRMFDNPRKDCIHSDRLVPCS